MNLTAKYRALYDAIVTGALPLDASGKRYDTAAFYAAWNAREAERSAPCPQ